MIFSVKHKGLRELFEDGKTAKIDRRLHRRIMERLDALDAAKTPEHLNLPGYNFHPLKGFNPVRYSIHVNGPVCITFEFDGENATGVDLENYH